MHNFDARNPGLILRKQDISSAEKRDIETYLGTLKPIWEKRYSANNPAPAGQENRGLLRPVYWLGNWQFACLDYYHPPKGIENRCVRAEPYPPVLQRIVHKCEDIVRESFERIDVPRDWHLNTCLINFYGDHVSPNGKREDCARVGEHKDFEPGPVASLSLGEKALFQFVKSEGSQEQSKLMVQQWLEDRDLQIFGGHRFKRQLFHRVQRVDRKLGSTFKPAIDDFETRRINFTFRFVPEEHIQPWSKLPTAAREDTREYVQELAKSSPFWNEALQKEGQP